MCSYFSFRKVNQLVLLRREIANLRNYIDEIYEKGKTEISKKDENGIQGQTSRSEVKSEVSNFYTAGS